MFKFLVAFLLTLFAYGSANRAADVRDDPPPDSCAPDCK